MKSNTIYITRQKIWAKTTKLYEVSWDGEDPSEALSRLKKYLKTRVRVVLGNDLAYVATFKVDPGKINRESLLAKAQTVIPESMDDHNFDWQLVAVQGEMKIVQVFSVANRLLNSLSFAAQRNKLKIEAIYPVQHLLAQIDSNNSDPRLVIWKSELEYLLSITQAGVSYLTENIASKSNQKIATALKYFKNNFGSQVNNLYVSAGAKSDLKLNKNWQVTEFDFDVFGIAAKQEVNNNKDEDVLLIEAVENPVAPDQYQFTVTDKEESKTTKGSDSQPKNRVPVIIFVIVGAIGIFIGLLYARQLQKPQDHAESATSGEVAEIQPITQLEPENEASEAAVVAAEEVNLADYKVQILNGTGVVGAADEVRDILEAEGFADFELDNADTYDYVATEILIKESLPAAVYENIDRALNGDYQLEKVTLDQASLYDVIVVVGVSDESD